MNVLKTNRGFDFELGMDVAIGCQTLGYVKKEFPHDYV